MEMTTDFKTYQNHITTSLVQVTRSAAQISNQDVGFHRSSSDRFSSSLDAQSAHLLRLTNKLLKAASKDTSFRPPTLQNRDDIEDNWRNIVDVVDDLLEKADRSLDEFTGVIKRLSPARQDGSEPPAKRSKHGSSMDQWSHSNMSKPQLLFERHVDNFEITPWKPLLATKPHANMPLEDSIGTGADGFKHPYAHEIQHMIYPSSIYKVSSPIEHTPIEESQPIFVDTEEAVKEMLSELRLAKEIAIDLEHNDKNSYIGLVCLMQISTRDKDWIVDTLKPWRENLQVLNEVFANPRIVKVFHGSTSDIIWLQRDLGLYIVGLFDTYHASNVLQFPAKSLKYLLHRFANFEAQKQYQLADWRVRPLPQELIDYARSDTHFLLYIFDCLRNMLVEASTPRENLIDHVLDSSRKEALQVYERPVYDVENGLNPGGWMRMLLQRATQLTNEQLGVFRAIHQWRDNKARELDEGEQNIMPNAFIWTIADIMPTYRGAFHQRGTGRLPRYVAENIPEIIEVVKQGAIQGKDGPSVYELIEKHSSKVGPMFGRNKFVRKKTEDPNRGLGATLHMLNESGELPTTPSAIEAVEAAAVSSGEPVVAKALLSQLWGSVEPLHVTSAANLGIITQALERILPLQGLVQKNSTATTLQEMATAPIQTTVFPMIENGSQSQVNKDEVFIIRERSRKRKASDVVSVEDQLDEQFKEDEPDRVTQVAEPQHVAIDEAMQSKRQIKQARKAEKRAKKDAEAQERATAQANMVPFDYSTADSMLHSRLEPAQNGVATGKKPKDKPLNPFVRALDASTGARRNRMGKELAGKSHTFKN